MMMTNLTYLFADLHPAADALLKATVFLALGWGMHFCLSRRNPRWRVLLWRAGLAGIVLVPLLSALAPDLEVTVEPPVADPIFFEAEEEDGAGAGFFEKAWGSLNQSVLIPDDVEDTSASERGVIATTPGFESDGSAVRWLSPPDLPTLAAVCWAVGVIVLARISVRSHRRVSRMIENSVDPTEDLLAILEQSAAELGPRRVPRLRFSSAVESPFLAGLRCPVILLPMRFAEKERSDDLPAILAHELSHLASRDLGWFAAFNGMTLLLWFHPLVWIARKMHSEACETLSDAVAAEQVGDADIYSGALARIALQMVNPMPSSAGIAMARSPQIMSRLNSLKREVLATRLGRKWVLAFLALGAAALSLVGSLRLVQAQEEKVEAKTDVDMVVYEMNRKVSDFPLNDLSTPESACATINRIGMAGGSGDDWKRISVRETARRIPGGDERNEVSPETVEMWNNGVIREVRIYKGKIARVFTEITRSGKTEFDQRSVTREDGRWLNSGHDGSVESLERAREIFAAKLWNLLPEEKPVRPEVEDPEAHLKPFVQFLKEKAEDPKAFVLKALAKHKVVIMGETHHRPRYWAFNASVVEDPEFAKHVGVIYMEMPMNDQPLLDEFLASEKLDTAPAIEMLRDVLWMGWPDQPMLDFFVSVWKVNQALPREKQLRIVAVDMQRPWKKIQDKGDFSQYDCDRDKLMAENMVKDLQKNQEEKRNAFFIVGVGHTSLNLMRPDNLTPNKDAGWHLCQKLGADSVYAFMQHRPVGDNWGGVQGRACLGLFDTAFARLDNKPMAFPLTEGPFGEQWFDAMSDDPVSESSTYGDGYSAFLYLGPLEDEIFSPLIPGFYDEEFMKEIDRRFRLSYGKSWHEAYRRDATNVENFVDWMSRSWGKPRRKWIAGMGPIDAWHRGDEWKKDIRDEKLQNAAEHPEIIVAVADRLIGAIREADYDNPKKWKTDPAAWKRFIKPDYCVYTDYPGWVKWICENFRDNPIVEVKYGEIFSEERKGFYGDGKLPHIPYKLTLKDGSVLEGILPFDYSVRSGEWMGYTGLDWHMQGRQGGRGRR
jgi:beta-lactamase regulating signal transducer with metallopeptidase domain